MADDEFGGSFFSAEMRVVEGFSFAWSMAGLDEELAAFSQRKAPNKLTLHAEIIHPDSVFMFQHIALFGNTGGVLFVDGLGDAGNTMKVELAEQAMSKPLNPLIGAYDLGPMERRSFTVEWIRKPSIGSIVPMLVVSGKLYQPAYVLP